jgi:lipopolysaccharide/colanic/teichoic acid biosynthesis glycosyltransferase
MLKRLVDVILSLMGLLLLLPVILVLCYKVANNLGKPIFFRQKRPGLHGKTFEMIKFRSMRDAFDPHGQPYPDEKRLTPFGQKLRNTSLDELPGLWSVLKGEMSLVGPRPLLIQYLPLYSNEQARRHEVKPGITGWAQINGRNAISWQQKFELDVWYVDNRNLWLDLKILFLTIKKVFAKEDISADEHATMPAFTGNEVKSADVNDENSYD